MIWRILVVLTFPIWLPIALAAFLVWLVIVIGLIGGSLSIIGWIAGPDSSAKNLSDRYEEWWSNA